MAVHATAAFSCCATGVLLRCGEFQLIAVLHDIYGLPRKDADMAKASSFPNVAIFEKMFFNEVLGGTLEDDANGKLVPLLPPTDVSSLLRNISWLSVKCLSSFCVVIVNFHASYLHPLVGMRFYFRTPLSAIKLS